MKPDRLLLIVLVIQCTAASCNGTGSGEDAGSSGHPDRVAEMSAALEIARLESGGTEEAGEGADLIAPRIECEHSDDCAGYPCVPGVQGFVCAGPCGQPDDCREGWGCVPDQWSEEWLCLPWNVSACMPCSADADCIGYGEVCVPYGTDGSFCGGSCGDDRPPCPDGFDCQQVDSVDGTAGKRCILETGKSCPCPSWGVLREASTQCVNSNEIGICEGQRLCTLKGLTPCDAPVPTSELCDGLDNDCDGEVDEELGIIVCGAGVCGHELSACVNGQMPTCDPLAGAQPEACDGLDNDCDGEADEELGVSVCGEGACAHELPACVNGQVPTCDPLAGSQPEACDGLDNDCDGTTDEELGWLTCGSGVCFNTVAACENGAANPCLPLDNIALEVCDGLDNDCDNIADNQFVDTDEDGEADCVDKDDDGDSIGDDQDNCQWAYNPGQKDADADGFGDACDNGCWVEEIEGWDGDCDGVFKFDNCPLHYNPMQVDLDGDGQGDLCDPDDDGDGLKDKLDNCPLIANAGQEDADKDGVGDACDGDLDGDGVADDADNCPLTANPGQGDFDEDLSGDVCDDDDDGDGDPDTSDCAHLDPAVSNLAEEVCNGKDDNCDLVVDEAGAVKCQIRYLDSDGDGFGIADQFDCLCIEMGKYSAKVAGDCAPDDGAINPGAEEVCNGVDDNCDGVTDEEFANVDGDEDADCVDLDDDDDGVADEADNCIAVPNFEQADYEQDGFGDACDDDDDNDGVGDQDDCQPFNAAQFPGGEEVCDLLDNDCNDKIDDDLGETICGLGECVHTVANCVDGMIQKCDPLAGAQAESCDLKDNDCDGEVDEELPVLECGLGECEHAVTACIGGVPQNCNPYQGATDESCDLKDNDCNGEVDDGLGSTMCGIGECQHTVPNCLDGIVQVCDPTDGYSEEVCDGKNNDCDGDVDEGLGQTSCGLGECLHTVHNCLDGTPQLCDPMQGWIPESCDGLDNDCDGEVDEDFEDFDGDGTPNCLDGDDDDDGSPDVEDCDDENALAYPGADELCDDADNNCNDWADEGCPGVVSGASCKTIRTDFPELPSGQYTIDPDGIWGNNPVEVYCDMDHDGGGWTRIANVDAEDGICPGQWMYTNLPKVCFRLALSSGCKSATFQAFGIEYGQVRGYVNAYQFNSMDGFHMYNPYDIDGPYVDGVSITYGLAPRQHLWTYAVGISQDAYYPDYNCPCGKFPGSGPPGFVGSDYYCESGNSGNWEETWYTNDPLYDGKGCPEGNSCCSPESLPWFTRDLPQLQAAPVEARLCSDQESNNEDVGVYRMELFVR